MNPAAAALEAFCSTPLDVHIDGRFVWVFGRGHHATSFYGANVFVERVREGLEHPEVRALLSGKFVMAVETDGERHPALALDVQLARGVEQGALDPAALAPHVRAALERLSSEFGANVPEAYRTPRIRTWPHAHSAHFPAGVKHRYVRER